MLVDGRGRPAGEARGKPGEVRGKPATGFENLEGLPNLGWSADMDMDALRISLDSDGGFATGSSVKRYGAGDDEVTGDGPAAAGFGRPTICSYFSTMSDIDVRLADRGLGTS